MKISNIFSVLSTLNNKHCRQSRFWTPRTILRSNLFYKPLQIKVPTNSSYQTQGFILGTRKLHESTPSEHIDSLLPGCTGVLGNPLINLSGITNAMKFVLTDESFNSIFFHKASNILIEVGFSQFIHDSPKELFELHRKVY